MLGSHLQKYLEDFFSPSARSLLPPLIEIPHLVWKAEVLLKGKEIGLGESVSRENTVLL
jgi:hypothetical protein